MKNLYQTTIMICLLCFSVISLSAQMAPPVPPFSVIGKVFDGNQEPIEIGNILILSKDSTLIKGDLFFDGVFRMDDITNEEIIVQLNALGFDDVYIPLNNAVNPVLNLGSIELSSITQLEEVVITGRRAPAFTQENGAIVVNVSNSILNDGSSTLIDVLSRSPKVLVDSDNNVSIFGKGEATILINGVRIASNDILATLNADDVLKIEILTNPGAQYDAEGRGGVINIITKKNKVEGFHTELDFTATQAAFQRGFYGIESSFKKGDINIIAAYNNNPNRLLFNESYERRILDGQNETLMLQDLEKDRRFRHEHNYRTGLDYSLSERSVIGLQYKGSFSKGTQLTTNTNDVFRNGAEDINLNTTTNSALEYTQNACNLSYSLLPSANDGRQLFLAIDHAEFNSEDQNDITESITGNENIDGLKRLQSRNDISITTAQVDYTQPLGSPGFTLKLGSKYATTNNRSIVDFEVNEADQWIQDFGRSNNYDYKEEVLAGYASLHKKIGKLSIDAGLRAEQTNAQGYSFANEQQIIDTTYLNFFPNLSISYDISDNLNWNVSFAKRISRPTIQELDPFLFYIDSLSIIRGNPLLVPENSYSIETSLTYMEFASINFGYVEANNALQPFVNQLEEGSDITVLSLQNLRRSRSYTASIVLPYQTKTWTTYNMFGTFFNTFDFEANGIDFQLQRPLWYVYSYQQIKLPANFSLEVTFQYNSSGAEGIFAFQPKYNLSAGIRKNMLDNKLSIRLSANDILRSDRLQSETNLDNFSAQYRSYFDRQYIRLAVTYKLGNPFEGKLRDKSTNKEELNRIKTE